MTDAGGPRVLVMNLRLPSFPRSGRDLRVAEQLHALASRGPAGMFALAGGGTPIDSRLEVWRSGTDPTPTRPIHGPDVARLIKEGISPLDQRYSDATALELAEVLRDFRPDVVVLGPLELYRYGEVVREVSDARLVLDLDETIVHVIPEIAAADAHRGRALLSRLLSKHLEGAEATAVASADQIWMSSDNEIAQFTDLYPDMAPGARVPNTVDVESYKWAERKDPLALVYPAGFFYVPNEDAARTLVDDILPNLPNAHLTLVGTSPPPWMLEIEDPRVTVTGEVDDVRPYLAAAGVMPVPLAAGGGTRLKVLEAFSAGLPVVSTEKGVEGLDLVDGRHYLRAEAPGEFVSAIERLHADPQLADALVAAGRALVIDRFSRDAQRRAVIAALDSVLAAPARR